MVAIAVILWGFADRRAHRRLVERAESDLREGTRRLRRVETEQRFTTRFLREFPGLTRELTNQKRYRDVPDVLVRALAQIFQAEQAIVVVSSELEGEEALVIASVFPEGGRIIPGMLNSPLLPAVFANRLNKGKPGLLECLQVASNGLIAHARFVDHFADGGPVATGTQSP